jgi:hypothetical protein
MNRLLTIFVLASALISTTVHAEGVIASTYDKTGAGIELTDTRCKPGPGKVARGFTSKGEPMKGCWTMVKGALSVDIHWEHGADRTYPLGRFDVTDYGKRYDHSLSQPQQ